ncbi:MAG: hypothetical protein V3V61_03060 [Gammaproteobacteria bacterium]
MSVWNEFLQQQGLHQQANHANYFSNNTQELTQAMTQCTLAELTPLGMIKVSGQNAADFLQGQLSCDIKQLTATSTLLGTYCNQQGRVIALFRVFKHNDDHYLHIQRDIISVTLAKLQQYAVFSKVTLEDYSDQMISIGLSGMGIESILADCFTCLPQKLNETYLDNDCFITRVPGHVTRFLLFGNSASIVKHWQKLATNLSIIAYPGWELLDIMAGIPSIHPQTQEKFLPHNLNLNQLGALNFDKGCYLGQEIIARMHYRGRLKQRMIRLHLETDQMIVPGVTIKDLQDKTMGYIVRSSVDPKGGTQVLAIMPLEIDSRKCVKIDECTIALSINDPKESNI